MIVEKDGLTTKDLYELKMMMKPVSRLRIRRIIKIIKFTWWIFRIFFEYRKLIKCNFEQIIKITLFKSKMYSDRLRGLKRLDNKKLKKFWDKRGQVICPH